MAIAVFLSVCLCLFLVLINLNTRVVFHSDPVFLALLAIGAMGEAVAVLLYSLPLNSSLCAAKTWLFDLGFQTCLASLVMKVLPGEMIVAVIFNNNSHSWRSGVH